MQFGGTSMTDRTRLLSLLGKHSAWKRLCIALLLLVSFSTLNGCRTTNGKLMNRSGMRYYRKGNYEYARNEFERALMDDPHNASYAFNVARTMEREGDYENAELMYQHALTLDPSHQPSYHGLAAMLREQGREGEAGDLLTAWAETQPYRPDAQMSAADLAYAEGDVARAQWYQQQAMRSQPMGRRQQRLANHYGYQNNQMMASNGIYGNPYSQYGVAPSLQMAYYMPRTDFTMMGGPVVAQHSLSYPGSQLPVQQYSPAVSPSPPMMQVPSPYPATQDHNTGWYGPSVMQESPIVARPSMPIPADNNWQETSLMVPEPIIQQTSHSVPAQRMAVPSAVQVGPAVRAF